MLLVSGLIAGLELDSTHSSTKGALESDDNCMGNAGAAESCGKACLVILIAAASFLA